MDLLHYCDLPTMRRWPVGTHPESTRFSDNVPST